MEVDLCLYYAIKQNRFESRTIDTAIKKCFIASKINVIKNVLMGIQKFCLQIQKFCLRIQKFFLQIQKFCLRIQKFCLLLS